MENIIFIVLFVATQIAIMLVSYFIGYSKGFKTCDKIDNELIDSFIECDEKHKELIIKLNDLVSNLIKLIKKENIDLN